MTIRLIFTGMLALALTACTTVEEIRYPYGRIPMALPAPDVDLSLYSSPKALAGFTLQGSLQPSNNNLKLFHYIDEQNPGRTLQIAIYPIPAGWDDLPPGRTVAGHYGQVRQESIERLVRQTENAVAITHEELSGEQQLDYPVAAAELRSEHRNHPLSKQLLLTAVPPLFIRLTLENRSTEIGELRQVAHEALVIFSSQLTTKQPRSEPDVDE